MKEGNLSRYESWFMLKDGRKVFLRPSMLDPMNDVIKHILRETGYKVKYTHKDGNTLVDISVEKS